MECKKVAELLPWLLNGSLAEGEEATVRAHLAECPRCSQELVESASAWAIHDAHPASSLLVDLAEGRPLAAEDRANVEEHLAGCAACQAELAMIRQTLATPLEEVASGGLALEVREPAGQDLRWGSLVAGLVALLSLAAALLLGRESSSARRAAAAAEQLATTLSTQVVEAERSAVEQGEQLRELERRLARLTAPRGGLALAELRPLSGRRRGAEPPPHSVEIFPATPEIVLVLLREDRTAYQSLRLRIVGPDGVEVWRGELATPADQPEMVVAVPASFLAQGDHRIEVEGLRGGRWQPSDRYALRLFQGADAPPAVD